MTDHLVEIFNTHLSSLRTYMDDPDIQEIMVNGPANIWIESRGSMEKLPLELNPTNVRGALTILANMSHPRGMQGVPPYLDGQRPGFRFAAVLHPYSVHGDAIAIRKHSRQVKSLQQYLDDGLLSCRPTPDCLKHAAPQAQSVARGGQALLDYLRWMMQAGKNLLLSGGTSTGKTTLLNALLQEIPLDRRLLILEDTRELSVIQPNLVQIECNAEQGLSMERGVKIMLRFRPDQPVIGEVRDGTAYDFLDALNTGHSGGICSIHADSAELALYRLEDLVRQNPKYAALPLSALRRKVASAIHYVIQASRHAGERFPLELMAVEGVDEQVRYITKRLYYRFF